MTREEWLNLAVEELRPLYPKDKEYKMPDVVRVAIGFPSSGGLGGKRRKLGECWMKEGTADKICQIYINPLIAEAAGEDGILGVLAHELVHAMGVSGHGKAFKRIGECIGLEGKMSCSIAGEGLQRKFDEIEKKLGKIPHSPILEPIAKKKKQTTRMLKIECACGYCLRGSKKVLDIGIPVCPVCQIQMNISE